MTDVDLHLLSRFGSTEAETAWAARLRDLVVRKGDDEWTRDRERLWKHYKAQLDTAHKDGDVVRDHMQTRSQLGDLAELLDDEDSAP